MRSAGFGGSRFLEMVMSRMIFPSDQKKGTTVPILSKFRRGAQDDQPLGWSPCPPCNWDCQAMHAVIEIGEALPITAARQLQSCTIIPMRGLMLPVGGHGARGIWKLQALHLDSFGMCSYFLADSSSILSHFGLCQHQIQRTYFNNFNN